MAPNLFGNSATLFLEASQQDVSQKKSTAETATQKLSLQKTQDSKLAKYQWKIVWRNVIAFVYLHVGAVYGLYLLLTVAKLYTFLWAVTFAAFAAVGVTGGAHRLWAHRSYKAKWPLRIILMIFQTMAFQNHIYEWVRDHRVHHKFTDSDADPHNAQRGFFFSHMGWLLIRKHPDVINKGATIDMSDLEKDFVIVWQRRLYIILMPLFCFLIPTWVPYQYWNEKPMYAWYATVFRYTLSLNLTWLVNSAAHIWGMKPYDKQITDVRYWSILTVTFPFTVTEFVCWLVNFAAHIWGMKPYDNSISPTDSLSVGLSAFGEGWHNYHHVFPWDYKAAELGNYRTNFTTAFIDFFAWLGWAYDLKTVAHDIVKRRANRTGDGSIYERAVATTVEYHDHHHSPEGAIWGWGDTDMTSEDMQNAEIINKSD